jgi:hypothetical protein
MKAKNFRRIILFALGVPILALSVLVFILYIKQDAIVRELVTTLNADFKGKLTITGSHISPFANFPYISIDLEGVKIYEDKLENSAAVFDISEIYVGFSINEIISGNYDIKAIKLKNGYMKLVQHLDGSYNIANALSSEKEIENVNEEFHLDLQRIELQNIDLIKINEENNVLLDFFVTEAKSKFKTGPERTDISLDSKFELSILKDGDSTFVKHKHFVLNTDLTFLAKENALRIADSEVQLEKALFRMSGNVDFDENLNLDILFEGEKPNFDLFLAFAPQELAPALNRYDNGGNIYFSAAIKGPCINGFNPKVTAEFGCENAFFNNIESKSKLDDLFFKGYFTTGEKGTPETMEFSLNDVRARPETGIFTGGLTVKNFYSPDINMQIKSQFELDFLAKFLNLEELQDLRGSVSLTMNFHDIIDLNNPEKSIEKLNESYFTELDVRNLGFKTPKYHLPVSDVNIRATMDGHTARIDLLEFKVGNSDIHLDAVVSDLPAILHHTSIPVDVALNIQSKRLDIRELTSGDIANSKPVDEVIRDLSMKFAFKSSAKSFTEFKNLPSGEFFIEDLYAKPEHYPHTLHDFHADIIIDEDNFSIVDFTGMVDKTDFHFSGKLEHYDLWFMDSPQGDTKIEFNLTSDLLRLEDLFAYKGENYVPEDYRHEELKQLKVHGFADLHFKDSLYSADINLDKFQASMKVHPMKFERFKGRLHFEDKHLVVENFSGKLGKSEFAIDMNLYLGKDESIKKRDNEIRLKASYVDFDELFSYNPPPSSKASQASQHDSVFSIFDLPFTDVRLQCDIGHFRYHRYIIDDLRLKARMQKDHFIYLDTLRLKAAGGSIGLKGYFNGSNRNNIYFSPTMVLDHVDLDKLLFKFDNFGQDHIVSENLHGEISGIITGKIHLHADLVPIIDDSEIHLDMKVTQGRLENYSAFEALADYFADKNLNNVRFDTLQNHIDIQNGIMSIPSMTINSTLGYIEISGKQDMNLNMEYFMRIPVKMATKAGLSKLFGGKAEVDPNQEDEIIYRDDNKRTRFINVKITGTPEDYKISMGKDDTK